MNRQNYTVALYLRSTLLVCTWLHLILISIFSSHGYRRTGSERQQSRGASGRRACVLQLNAAPQCPAQDLSLIWTPPAWNRPCTAFSPLFQRDYLDAGRPDCPQSKDLPLSSVLRLWQELGLHPVLDKRGLRRNNPNCRKRMGYWKMEKLRRCVRSLGRCFVTKTALMETEFQALLIGQTEPKTHQLPQAPLGLEPETSSLPIMGIWAPRGLS